MNNNNEHRPIDTESTMNRLQREDRFLAHGHVYGTMSPLPDKLTEDMVKEHSGGDPWYQFLEEQTRSMHAKGYSGGPLIYTKNMEDNHE